MSSQDTITNLSKQFNRQPLDFLFHAYNILEIESEKPIKAKKEELIKKILDSDNLDYFKLLSIINDFSRIKNEVFINQLFDDNFEKLQNIFKTLTPLQKVELNKFNKLTLIYFLNNKLFNDIHFISWWKKEESTNKYVASEPANVPNDLVKILLEKDNTFIEKIKELEKSVYKKSFDLTFGKNHFIFWKKQISDEIEEDIEENKRVKGSNIIGICISDDGKNLEIKSKSKKSSENIKKILEKDILKINYTIFEESSDKPYSTSLEHSVTLPTSEIKLIEISFINSKLDNSPELKIKHKENDIFNSIKQLQDANIVENDLKNIAHFRILWNDIPFKISIELDEVNNRYKLISTRPLEDEDKRTFYKDFSSKFRRPLNRWISFDQDSSKELYFDKFLKNGMLISENDLSSGILKELLSKKLVKIVDSQYIKCYNNDDEDCFSAPQCEGIILFNDGTSVYRCPQCDREIDLESTNKHKFRENKVTLDIEAIKSYIINLLKANDFGFNEKEITVDNKKYIIYDVKLEEEKVGILILNAPIGPGMIHFLEKYKLPVVFILLDSSIICRNIIDVSLYPQASFGRLLEIEKSGDFKNYITHLIHKSYQHSLTLYEKASKISHKNLENIPQNYTHRDFEIDVFNILKYIIPSCDKMGDSSIGKALPDGLFSLHYSKNSETSNTAYIYDCKWSYVNIENSSKGFELDRSEYRKILEHIRHINQTNEISRQFNGCIKSFILFSNKLNESRFGKMMEYLEGEANFFNENLNLNIVFFEIDALLYFYEQVVKKKDDIEQRREIFYENLNDLLHNPKLHQNKDDPLESKNNRVLRIDKKDISHIINSTLEEKKIYDFVSSKNITKYLAQKGVLAA